MKDIFKILEKNNKATLQKTVSIQSSETQNSEWQAIKLIESSAQLMLRRMSEALPLGYESNIINVRLQLFKNLGNGDRIFVKAQLYQYNKKHFQLKVFAHEIDRKNKSSKLAKAVYDVQVGEIENSRRVA